MNLYLLANLRKLWYQGRSSSFPVVEKMGKLVFEKLRYPKLDGFPAYYDEYNDLSFHQNHDWKPRQKLKQWRLFKFWFH